jgi:aquaporin Z
MTIPAQPESFVSTPAGHPVYHADASGTSRTRGAASTLRRHWPEYLMEGALLGMFMVSACGFTALLEYPYSPAYLAIPSSFIRRMLVGLAMGATAVALIYSPWGKQSGAHFNPAVTLAFYRLRKIEHWDAIFYVLAQFLGGTAGVLATSAVLGDVVRHHSVNYVVTVPGSAGTLIAFLAEFAISMVLMLTVLTAMNTVRLARFTGWFAGILVALYITVEAPLSGMSMNPARSFGSALPANLWTAWWIYFTAPPLGMLLAAELYQRRNRIPVICAKLHHHNDKRCIFRCGYRSAQNSTRAA